MLVKCVCYEEIYELFIPFVMRMNADIPLIYLPYQNISSDLSGQQMGRMALVRWTDWIVLVWPSLLAIERCFRNEHVNRSNPLLFSKF